MQFSQIKILKRNYLSLFCIPYRKRALEKDFGVVLVIGKDFKERRKIGNITLPVPTTAAP